MSLEISAETSFALDLTNQTYGPELLTNGSFTAWTEPGAPNDHPNLFSLSGNDADNYATQDPSGHLKIVTIITGNLLLYINALGSGTNSYKLTGSCTSSSGSGLIIYLGTGNQHTVNSSGTFSTTITNAGDNVFYIQSVGVNDTTLDYLSLKQIL